MNAVTAILHCIDENGYVDKVSYGTSMGRDSVQHYKEIEIRKMPYGQAMAMLFLQEVIKANAKD